MIVYTHHDDMGIAVASILVSARADFMHYFTGGDHEFHIADGELHQKTSDALELFAANNDYVRIAT